MNPALVILNPRRIAECVASLKALDVAKVWLTGYTERQLEPVFEAMVQDTAFSHYVVISDDAIVSQDALDCVLRMLATHPVATGWSELAADDDRVNLTRSPLRYEFPQGDAYDLFTRAEVGAMPRKPFRTWFAGLALTGMPRAHWLRFPFRCFYSGANDPGNASDYHLSRRLDAAGERIVSHPDAGVEHVKERWNHGDTDPRKRLLVGRIAPSVRIEAK